MAVWFNFYYKPTTESYAGLQTGEMKKVELRFAMPLDETQRLHHFFHTVNLNYTDGWLMVGKINL